MAIWKLKAGNAEIKINDWDHLPPHCHVRLDKGRFLANIETLEVMKPRNAKIPPAVRRTLKMQQEELLEAWQHVTILR